MKSTNHSLNSLMSGNSLWVFAYGSLLWKPCFKYDRQVVGHIKGFKRRFFQGNTNLRGTQTKPGRVAILVPDEEEVTWGVAFEVRGKQHVQHAVEHLYVRENQCGGYSCMLVPFHPRRTTSSRSPSPANSSDDSDSERDEESDAPSDSDSDLDLPTDLEPFTVLSFTATSASSLYMGPADVNTMATQVVAAEGNAGPNSEYVLRTAEYVRCHIPEDRDMHLFELERAVREQILKKQYVNYEVPGLQPRKEDHTDHTPHTVAAV